MSNSRDLNTTTSNVARRSLLERYFSIFSIASSFLVFGCIGSCFLTSFLFGQKKLDSPEGAVKVAARIAEWTLPPRFEGKLGLIVDNPWFKVDFAKFVQQQGRGLIVVGQVQANALLFTQQQSLTEQTIERISPELKTLKVDQTRTLQLTINNLPARFQIQQGEDRASNTRLLQVTGHFRGKRDDALLILQYEDGVLSEQEVEQFLKSIK